MLLHWHLVRDLIRLHGDVFDLKEGGEKNEEGHTECVCVLMILREYYKFSQISSVEINFQTRIELIFMMWIWKGWTRNESNELNTFIVTAPQITRDYPTK